MVGWMRTTSFWRIGILIGVLMGIVWSVVPLHAEPVDTVVLQVGAEGWSGGVAGAFVQLQSQGGSFERVAASTNEAGQATLDVAGLSGPYVLTVSAPGAAVRRIQLALPLNQSVLPKITLAAAASRLRGLPAYGGQITAVQADAQSGVFYTIANTPPFFFRSTDYAGTWSPVTTQSDDADDGLDDTTTPVGIAVSGVPGEVATIVANAVYYSHDFGASWRSFALPGSGDIHDVGLYWAHAAVADAPSFMFVERAEHVYVCGAMMPTATPACVVDDGYKAAADDLLAVAHGAEHAFVGVLADGVHADATLWVVDATPSSADATATVAQISAGARDPGLAANVFMMGGPAQATLTFGGETVNDAPERFVHFARNSAGRSDGSIRMTSWHDGAYVTNAAGSAGLKFVTTSEAVAANTSGFGRIPPGADEVQCGVDDTMMPAMALAPSASAYASFGMCWLTHDRVNNLLEVRAVQGINNNTGLAFDAGFDGSTNAVVVSGDGARGLVKSAQPLLTSGTWPTDPRWPTGAPALLNRPDGFPPRDFVPADFETQYMATAGTAADAGGYAIRGITAPVVRDLAYSPDSGDEIATAFSFTGGGRVVVSNTGGERWWTIADSGADMIDWWAGTGTQEWIVTATRAGTLQACVLPSGHVQQRGDCAALAEIADVNPTTLWRTIVDDETATLPADTVIEVRTVRGLPRVSGVTASGCTGDRGYVMLGVAYQQPAAPFHSAVVVAELCHSSGAYTVRMDQMFRLPKAIVDTAAVCTVADGSLRGFVGLRDPSVLRSSHGTALQDCAECTASQAAAAKGGVIALPDIREMLFELADNGVAGALRGNRLLGAALITGRDVVDVKAACASGEVIVGMSDGVLAPPPDDGGGDGGTPPECPDDPYPDAGYPVGCDTTQRVQSTRVESRLQSGEPAAVMVSTNMGERFHEVEARGLPTPLRNIYRVAVNAGRMLVITRDGDLAGSDDGVNWRLINDHTDNAGRRFGGEPPGDIEWPPDTRGIDGLPRTPTANSRRGSVHQGRAVVTTGASVSRAVLGSGAGVFTLTLGSEPRAPTPTASPSPTMVGAASLQARYSFSDVDPKSGAYLDVRKRNRLSCVNPNQCPTVGLGAVSGIALTFTDTQNALVMDKALAFARKHFTVSLWYKRGDTAAGDVTLLRYGDGSYTSIEMQLLDGSDAAFGPACTFAGVTVYADNTTTAPSSWTYDDRWHQVTCEYDATTQRLRIAHDGVFVDNPGVSIQPRIFAKTERLTLLPVAADDATVDVSLDELAVHAEPLAGSVGEWYNQLLPLGGTPAPTVTVTASVTTTPSKTTTPTKTATATATATIPGAGRKFQWWSFDEPDNSRMFADLSGKLRFGCEVQRCPYAMSDGVRSRALEFVAADEQAMDVLGKVSLAKTWAISLWVGSAPVASDMTVLSTVVNGPPYVGTRLEIGLDAQGHAVCGFGDASPATSVTEVDDGYWHQVVCTYDAKSKQRQLFVDGVLAATTTVDFKPKPAPLRLGGRSTGSSIAATDQYASVYVDELIVYASIPLQYDVEMLYNAFAPTGSTLYPTLTATASTTPTASRTFTPSRTATLVPTETSTPADATQTALASITPTLTPTATDVASKGRAARYTFDDAGASVFADSVGKTPLVCVRASTGKNTPTATINPTFCPDPAADALRGQALEFTGVEYVQSSTGMRLTGDMTLTVWMRSAVSGGEQHLLSTGANALTIGLDESGRPFCGIGDTVVKATSAVTDDQWHQLACRYDRKTSQATLLVNASKMGSVTLTTAQTAVLKTTASKGVMTIGRGEGYLGAYRGLLDELLIYKTALSDWEVSQLYAGYYRP